MRNKIYTARDFRISDRVITLVEKHGGRSGDVINE
jgi:hypothetical protein